MTTSAKESTTAALRVNWLDRWLIHTTYVSKKSYRSACRSEHEKRWANPADSLMERRKEEKIFDGNFSLKFSADRFLSLLLRFYLITSLRTLERDDVNIALEFNAQEHTFLRIHFTDTCHSARMTVFAAVDILIAFVRSRGRRFHLIGTLDEHTFSVRSRGESSLVYFRRVLSGVFRHFSCHHLSCFHCFFATSCCRSLLLQFVGRFQVPIVVFAEIDDSKANISKVKVTFIAHRMNSSSHRPKHRSIPPTKAIF